MADLLNEWILPLDQATLDGLHRLLHDANGRVTLKTSAVDALDLPEEIRRVLADVVDAMRRGQAISVMPSPQRLTTQETTDLLGVSRPTRVKLLEAGAIPYETLSGTDVCGSPTYSPTKTFVGRSAGQPSTNSLRKQLTSGSTTTRPNLRVRVSRCAREAGLTMSRQPSTPAFWRWWLSWTP
jgi:hypothetical protein